MTQLATVGNLNEYPVEDSRELQALRHPTATVTGLGSGYVGQWLGIPQSRVLLPLTTVFRNPRPDAIVPMQGPGLMIIEAKYSPLLSDAGRERSSVTTRAYLSGREATVRAIPCLALVRGLLERDDLEGARKLLDALQPEAGTAREVQRLRRVLAPPRVTASPATDIDRSREYNWLRHHWEDYRGKWVAVQDDDIVAVAATLKQLQEALKELKLRRLPLVQRVD